MGMSWGRWDTGGGGDGEKNEMENLHYGSCYNLLQQIEKVFLSALQ